MPFLSPPLCCIWNIPLYILSSRCYFPVKLKTAKADSLASEALLFSSILSSSLLQHCFQIHMCCLNEKEENT